MKLRLNKYLAQCGLGSRRKVEELVLARRISVNGRTIINLATTIDAETDKVFLDKKPLSPLRRFTYIMLNKPIGYITTTVDTEGRPTVMDMIPEKFRRQGVFPVGRLDKDTEGLLILTNDGDLSHRLNHPSFKVDKEYSAELDREVTAEDQKKIEDGFYIHQLKLKTKPSTIRFIDAWRKKVIITVREGKKRQIRYTFKNLGYKIAKLRRIAYGPLKLGKLYRGSVRVLSEKEIRSLAASVSRKNA